MNIELRSVTITTHAPGYWPKCNYHRCCMSQVVVEKGNNNVAIEYECDMCIGTQTRQVLIEKFTKRHRGFLEWKKTQEIRIQLAKNRRTDSYLIVNSDL